MSVEIGGRVAPGLERLVEAFAANFTRGDDYEEVGAALVVMREGEELSAAALVSSCRERIAAFKLPKRVLSLSELPKNATGKVERGTLRAQAEKPQNR